jgi:hypothetical protein
MLVRRALAAVLAAALALPASALAHGDPTAHYLESDSLLTSYASPPDVAVELQLRGVLDAAAAHGYPIKVVLFANENDTGGEPEPLEDTQDYAGLVGTQLSEVRPLRAPVLIVTPKRYGIGGTPGAAGLARGLTLPQTDNGTALANAAMVAVRRLAAESGHALPKQIPPARNNPYGILESARRDTQTAGGPWLIVGVVAVSVLLLALLVVLYRRSPAGGRYINVN